MKRSKKGVQVGSIHNEVQIDNRLTSLKPSAFVLDQTSPNNVRSNIDTRCLEKRPELLHIFLSNEIGKAGQVQWRCLPGVFKANKFV